MMRIKRLSFVLSLAAGLSVVVVSLFGLYGLTKRPGIPKEFLDRSIARIDAFDIRNSTDVGFVLNRKKIGDPLEIRFRSDGGSEVVRAFVVPYYSQAPFPLVYVLIGSFSFIVGFGVFFLKAQDLRARIFYWLSLSFGASVIIGGSILGGPGKLLTMAPAVLFNFTYPLTLAFLWRFTRSFSPPRKKERPVFFWSLPLAWGVFLCSTLLYSYLKPSLDAYRIRQQAFHVFRLYVILVSAAAIIELVRAFRHASSEEDRALIKWYIFGLVAGLGPFLLFFQAPLVFSNKPLLPEDFASAFLFLIPIFITMTILQFRLLRINVVFHRGLIYSLLTLFTLSAYLFSIEALRRLFNRTTSAGENLISLATAVVIALVFNPGRRKTQLLVDKIFFRQAYDYRKAVVDFKTKAPAAADTPRLFGLFTEAVMSALPLEKIGALICEMKEDAPKILFQRGLGEAAARTLLSLPAQSPQAWAKADRIRTTEGVDFSKEDLLDSMGMEIVLPVQDGLGPPDRYLAFGRKASGHRFTKEDLDLLEALSGELISQLRRIRLQEEIIYERASREKSEELSRLKTEFISSVSHELRTPMSSLQGLSELLQSGKIKEDARRAHLLNLMAGECGRLSRFLHNVLDFGKIEQKSKSYDFRETALQPLIREVADLIAAGCPPAELNLRVEAPDSPVFITADPDAVRQALLNLLDNAIKYSPGRKDVIISLVIEPEIVEIQVRDKGIGIAPGDRERIFEAFFRSPLAAAHVPSGVGLGLSIVKHIMDAHKGRIELESEPGQGSVFSLAFPSR